MCDSTKSKIVKVPVLLLIEIGQTLSKCILKSDYTSKHDEYLKKLEYYLQGCLFKENVNIPLYVIETAIQDFPPDHYYIKRLKELLPKEEYFIFPNPVCSFSALVTKEAPFVIAKDVCDPEDKDKSILIIDSLYTVEVSDKYKSRGYTMIKFKKKN